MELVYLLMFVGIYALKAFGMLAIFLSVVAIVCSIVER